MKIPDLILEAVREGVPVTMEHHADYGIGFNVNTEAKSEIVIYQQNGKYIAHMRYGDKDEVSSFEELVSLVHYATHGRNYVSDVWRDILVKHDLIVVGK